MKNMREQDIPEDVYFLSLNPPAWVTKLQKGVYSMKELKKITKLTQCSIVKQLLKYGAKRKVGRNENNQLIFYYYWDGYKDGHTDNYEELDA